MSWKPIDPPPPLKSGAATRTIKLIYSNRSGAWVHVGSDLAEELGWAAGDKFAVARGYAESQGKLRFQKTESGQFIAQRLPGGKSKTGHGVKIRLGFLDDVPPELTGAKTTPFHIIEPNGRVDITVPSFEELTEPDRQNVVGFLKS